MSVNSLHTNHYKEIITTLFNVHRRGSVLLLDGDGSNRIANRLIFAAHSFLKIYMSFLFQYLTAFYHHVIISELACLIKLKNSRGEIHITHAPRVVSFMT
jgi:hypothetical protein